MNSDTPRTDAAETIEGGLQVVHASFARQLERELNQGTQAATSEGGGSVSSDPLKPSASLLIKLGSIIVHQEEVASSKGHHFDVAALDSVRNDPEVIEWMEQMNKLAFLPVKRRAK